MKFPSEQGIKEKILQIEKEESKQYKTAIDFLIKQVLDSKSAATWRLQGVSKKNKKTVLRKMFNKLAAAWVEEKSDEQACACAELYRSTFNRWKDSIRDEMNYDIIADIKLICKEKKSALRIKKVQEIAERANRPDLLYKVEEYHFRKAQEKRVAKREEYLDKLPPMHSPQGLPHQVTENHLHVHMSQTQQKEEKELYKDLLEKYTRRKRI